MNKKICKKIFYALLVFAPLSYLSYIQLWYSSPEVNSGIFALQQSFSFHKLDAWAAKFSPDNKYFVSGSADSTVVITELANTKNSKVIKVPSGVTYLTINSGSSFLATASYDGIVRLWSFPDGKFLRQLSGHNAAVWSVSFSPDGELLASSGEDASIVIWNVETGEVVKKLTGHQRTIWDIKFNPQGNLLASGSFDNTIKIWNVSDGKLLSTLQDHSQAIVALAFSHNSKKLVSTSDDKSIKIWDTENWQVTKTLNVPEHAQAVDFSSNDQYILTGGRDKTEIGEFLQNIFGDSQYNKGVSIRLWDANSGTLIQTFRSHQNDVNDLAFNPVGDHFISASSDRTVKLWCLKNK